MWFTSLHVSILIDLGGLHEAVWGDHIMACGNDNFGSWWQKFIFFVGLFIEIAVWLYFYHSTGPRNSEIHPQLSCLRNGALCQSPWPGCGGRWPALGTISTCHCRPPIVEMHVTNWAKDQREDLMLSTVLDWLKAWKQTNLKIFQAEHASSEEGKLILQNWQNFTIYQGALYLCSMPKGTTEDHLLFVVPKAHCVAALNGCHLDARSSRAWSYHVFVAGTLLVARNDQLG